MKCTIRMLSMIFCIGLIGCGEGPPPSAAEVQGKYAGSYAGGIEEFELRADSTFSQVFKIGGAVIYSSEGKWKIQGREIILEPLKAPGAMYGQQANLVAPHGQCRW